MSDFQCKEENEDNLSSVCPSSGGLPLETSVSISLQEGLDAHQLL